MTRARQEEGFTLVTAIIVMVVVLGLGVALLAYGNGQQHAAGREQWHEGAYALAEAALNAQIAQLGVTWPTSTAQAPASCNHANAGSTTGCPNPSFDQAYTVGGRTCPAGTTGDAWASAGTPVSNGWTTYVRDDGAGTSSLFNSTTDSSQLRYDAAGNASGGPDGALWVRAVGVQNCQVVTVVTKVAEQLVPLTFPRQAVTANAMHTSNQGNKVIVNTLGTAAQAGGISLRCQSLAAGQQCASYQQASSNRQSQVSPDTCQANASYQCTYAPVSPAQTFGSATLAQLKAEAQAYNTYFGPGGQPCPTTSDISVLTGQSLAGAIIPVYADCNLSFTTGTANSASDPGFLVIGNGTLTMAGNATFYGLVYAANLQGCSSTTPCLNGTSDVVDIHGNATLQGALDVDGTGSIAFGSSAVNFVYDTSAFARLKSWGGAVGAPNTFRLLASGQ